MGAAIVPGDDITEDEDLPKVELLSAWFCPYAQRAWIALEEKCTRGGFSVTESIKINSATRSFVKAPLLVEKNPKAMVPVIIDRRGGDGPQEVVVYESLVCVEYIDEAIGRKGDSKPSLLPGPPSQRAHARMWAEKLNSGVCNEFYRLLLSRDEEGRERADANILSGLREFGQSCVGPFFYGEELSLVDIVIAPWAVRVRMDVLKHYRGFQVPRDDNYGKYWEWSAAVSKHPSFVATVSYDILAMIEV